MKNQPYNRAITLGEGKTPLIRLFNLEKLFDWKGQLWAKAEYQNPTGSFKDRGSVMEIQEALKQKKKGVVCASTGNMAASLSAYAARAKMKCLVVVPKSTAVAKLRQAIICGAELVQIDGSYDECVKEAEEIAKKENFLLCGDYEVRRKGQRSIGRELANFSTKFDVVICPVGNGTVGCAVIEGFRECNQQPKFIGVQGLGSDPLTKAWENNQFAFKAIKNPLSLASAMKVGNPLDGNLTLQYIKEVGGEMVSVDDEKIISAQKILAKEEGIYVELSAAATIAGFKKVKKMLDPSLKLILILTGSGLKEGGDIYVDRR